MDFSLHFPPPEPLHTILSGLLNETAARAVGLWRVTGERLVALGFLAVSDMPTEVSRGFAAATAEVSLSQTGLGIVKAVLSQAPAIALEDPQTTGLPGSASWLVRFEARQSLSLPVIREGNVVGVIAVALPKEFAASSPEWQTIERFAAEVCPELCAGK